MRNVKTQENRNSKLAAYPVLFLTSFLGGGSLCVLGAFFFMGSFEWIPLHLSEKEVLVWDALLCLLFFIQHSLMVRKSFRQRIEKSIPPSYYPAIYSICSGMTLFVLLVFWQQSSHVLLSLSGTARWIMRILLLLGAGGFFWGVWSLGSFDTFGIERVLKHVNNKTLSHLPFTVKGPYLWVRHPLYSFMLLIIWACPDITTDRLLFNVFWTIWIIIGTKLEERDLSVEFGDTYRKYQKKVPMLIPYRIP